MAVARWMLQLSILTRAAACRYNDEEHIKMVMKRVEENDPNALCQMGGLRYYLCHEKSSEGGS
jgi:hypothetical protein